jgi:hypothetical protein
MPVSETEMLWGALLFELGVPSAAIIVMLRSPRLRKFVIVVLGAVTSLVLLYGAVVVAFLLNPNKGNIFAFYAMWVMSFFAYAAILLGGMALAFVPRPSNLYARFFIGFASAPLSYALLNIMS